MDAAACCDYFFSILLINVHSCTIIMRSTLFTTTSVALLGAVLAVVEPTDPYRVSDSMAAVLAYNSSAYHYVREWKHLHCMPRCVRGWV